MAKKINKKEFELLAQLKHGDKYCYSNVIYVNCITKINIKCKFHNKIFQQTPAGHLAGKGCKECGVINRAKKGTSNTNDFIKKANKKHNFNYDYFKTKYIKNTLKVVITCRTHGDFYQVANVHLSGGGCPGCGNNNRSLSQSLTTADFIAKSNIVHNHKYDYSMSNCINSKSVIRIICPKHGEFKKSAVKHIAGQGCQICSTDQKNQNNRLTKKQFIDKSNKIHNNYYDYNKIIYNTANDKVIIICPVHGDFEQLAYSHYSGQGCKLCRGRVSKNGSYYLNLIEINDREVKLKLNNNIYYFDGYDPVNKIVYEFNGDYWHGNPIKYRCNKINVINNITYGVLYNNTIQKEKILKNNGYLLVSIWETEFNNIKKMYKNNEKLFKYHLQCFIDYQLMYYQSEFSNTDVQTKFLPEAPVTVSSTS